MLEQIDLKHNKMVYSVKTVSDIEKMLYINYKSDNINFESGYRNNIYEIHGYKDKEKIFNRFININTKNILDLLDSSRDKYTSISILNYNNSEHKDKYSYIIDLNNINLSINKDNICCWDGKRNLNVYGQKYGVIDVTDLKEKYNILDNGFSCYNIEESKRTRCIISDSEYSIIDYKLFHNRLKCKYTNSIFLSLQPTLIEYPGGEIKCEYDQYGMMKSYKNGNKIYSDDSCNYKIKETNDETYITSIHPHVMDKFNYDCEEIDKYIACDRLSTDRYSVVFSRTVYKK